MKKLTFVETPDNLIILTYLYNSYLLESLVIQTTNIIKDVAIAREIVIEKILVFLSKEEKVKDFIENNKVLRHKLKSYLKKIVFHAALDEKNRRKVQIIPLADNGNFTTDTSINDENEYIEKLSTIIEKASLNENERKLLNLLLVGNSNHEISVIFNIPKKDVAKRKCRLIKKLKMLALKSG